MTITIKLETDNAAFEDGSGREVARILRKLAVKIQDDDLEALTGGKLMDVNGNSVGTWEVSV